MKYPKLYRYQCYLEIKSQSGLYHTVYAKNIKEAKKLYLKYFFLPEKLSSKVQYYRSNNEE